MEKFDEEIKKAKDEYTPSPGFVDATMRRISPSKPRWHFSIKVWGGLLIGGLALAAVAFVIMPRFFSSPDNAPVAQTETTQKNNGSSQQSTASQPSGTTDNTSLDTDLASVNDSLTTAGADQASADNALNDSSEQVTIPTE